MFQELMPLLAQRMLILTLSRASGETICVNVIPKPLKSESREGEDALTTPLAVTGTPRELDEQLAAQLVQFVETHLGLSSTLKSAKEQMDTAAKAAREAARRSTATKSHSSSDKNANSVSLQTRAEAVSKESSLEAQSNAESTQGPTVAAEGGSRGADTRSLFDVESTNNN